MQIRWCWLVRKPFWCGRFFFVYADHSDEPDTTQIRLNLSNIKIANNMRLLVLDMVGCIDSRVVHG